MKFKIKSKGNPQVGDTKVVTKFLLFPLRIGNEIRWLERATIEYTYKSYLGTYDLDAYEMWWWFPTGWIN